LFPLLCTMTSKSNVSDVTLMVKYGLPLMLNPSPKQHIPRTSLDRLGWQRTRQVLSIRHISELYTSSCKRIGGCLNGLLLPGADIHFCSIQYESLRYHPANSASASLYIRRSDFEHTVTRIILSFTLNKDSICMLTSMIVVSGLNLGGVKIGAQ